ncbi:MAG TPA: Gfo/Idh/MocA family oxidoreductase, partial [Erysipelothrix sp.]|nr:Gfo/Idh/MocA family oxidoreductase [Erysipelothrix sp.]
PIRYFNLGHGFKNKGDGSMRIGVVGTGSIVSWFMKAARLVDDVEFTAVYSRRQNTGEVFAKENNLQKVYTNYEEMLKDDALDAIYIASPNSLHYEHALKALNHHKHVLVEKPFTGNVDKAKEIIELAQEKDLILMEAICNVHMPHMDYIQKRLPELGKLKIVQANFSQYSSRYNALKNDEVMNVFDPAMSGGSLADINIYNLHFTMYLFGVPKAIDYKANLYKNGIDTSGILTLDYGDFKAVLVGAKDSFSYNLVQIQGEDGYILVPSSSSTLDSVVFETHETRRDVDNQDKPNLYYQVETFKELINHKDYTRRDELLEHSLNVVKVAVEARKQIGLDFDY